MSDTKLTRRSFIGTSAAVAAGTTLAAPAAIAANGPITLRMQTHWSPGVWYYQSIYEDFAKRVTEASGGEIQFETFQANAIVPTGDMLTGLRRGLVDVAFLFPGYWVGKIPSAGHLNGNLMTWENHEEMQLFFYEMGALDVIREAYAEHGVYQAGPISYGGLALYSKKPVATKADFADFKIRSNGTPAKVFEKMGATPVTIPGGELYQALQTGVVDAAHWGGISTGWGVNLQEVTDHIITPNFLSHTNGELMVSMDRWENLGSEHKQLLNDQVRATSAQASAHFLREDWRRIQDFQADFGGTISNVDQGVMDELRVHSLSVVDEISEQDPKYSGRVGAMMHEFMKLSGRA